MTEHVDPSEIEHIVGANRSELLHIGRAVSAEQHVYIMHSAECRNECEDLRDCPFSVTLDHGIRMSDWEHFEDIPVVLAISVDGYLVPYTGDAWMPL